VRGRLPPPRAARREIFSSNPQLRQPGAAIRQRDKPQSTCLAPGWHGPTLRRPSLAVASDTPLGALDFPDPVAYGLPDLTGREPTA